MKLMKNLCRRETELTEQERLFSADVDDKTFVYLRSTAYFVQLILFLPYLRFR